MTTFASAIKEERHDEAEIRELARKMVEAHKLQAAKQASQATNQQSFLGTSLLAQQQQQQQPSILNYLTRKPATTAGLTTTTATMQTSGNMTSNANGHNNSNSTEEAKPADDESLKGHFGWESFNGGKIHIPYIIRQTEKYCAVRIVESKLLNKYLNVLHQDLYNCTNIRSYYITDVEARLLDEINFRHCDQYFGKEKFSMKDLIVRLSDAQKFQQFLDVCYKKLTNLSTPNDKCGFIRINSESVVPYTVRDSHKMVPLFYFEGETDNLKLKADSLSGWDLSYLKFCCKVQGIRNELFASETVAVISLDDIKSYFPQGTIFEDYWPNKVVDTQLLMPQKSHNSTVNWTNPPPKAQQLPQQPQAPQPQKTTQQTPQAPQQTRMAGSSLQHMYQQNMDMSYLRSMQTAGMTNQQASLAALALTNGWNSQLTQSQLDQMFRLSTQQSKQQTSSTRTYSNRQQQQQNQTQQQQMQNLLQSGLYPYSTSSMSMSSNGHSRNNSSQQPPPLIRGQQQQQQQQQSQMSNGSTAQLQLRSSSSTTQSSNSSSPYPPYPASNSNNNSSSSNGNNVVTITRCPTSSSSTTASSNNNNNNNGQNGNNQNPSSYLNRIPASTTITPTQYYNNKDHSLSSSLSIYPKNSQNGNARNIIQSNISPIIASPTRASPQAGYAKQPSISPASQMHNIPAAIQQQFDELFIKQNFSGINNPELLKQTLMQYTNMYAKVQQHQQQSDSGAGNQSLNSSSLSSSSQYPLRNKSVITTSRASAMDVIDLSNSPTPSRSMNTVAALQLQQAQAAVVSAANKRAHNGTYLNGSSQSTTRSMQSSASTRLQQMQMQSALTGMNGYGSPYKIEKTYVENQMVHCINMIPYSPNSDMIIPLSELRDQFYPNANLDICKRVMQALEINLYSGTKPQYQAYSELGKTIADNVPFVRVCDVITFMPQINYMIRGQLVEAKNANKRTRIS